MLRYVPRMRPRRRTAPALLVLAVAGVALAGCAPTPPPPTLTAQEIEAIGARGASTVGELRAALPEGTLALLDAGMAMGLSSQRLTLGGPPGPEFDDWVVVGLCGYPEGSPALEAAAVPPELAERVDDAGAWDLRCAGGPEGWRPDADAARP